MDFLCAFSAESACFGYSYSTCTAEKAHLSKPSVWILRFILSCVPYPLVIRSRSSLLFSFALPQTGKTKTAFGIGRGEWRGFMYLQWNRIPKIYEKSVDAYGIKSRCFAGFASRNLRTNPPPSALSERQRV